MRIALIALGLATLTACSEQASDGSAPSGFVVGDEQALVQKVSSEAEAPEGARVVKLPPADVTVGNVSVFNGAYPAAMTFAREECIKQGLDAVRVSDITPDGFVQFNCVPFRGPS